MATPLSAILLDAKDLSDLLNNSVVGDPTWRRWANQGKERLYRLLVVKAPGRFHREADAVLTGVGDNAIPFPTAFRQLREQGITKDPDNQSHRITLKKFNFAARDAQGQLPAWGSGRELGYDIRSTEFIVEPALLCAGAYRVYYLYGPTVWATNGSDDGTNIESVFEPYVDYIAHWMAIKGAAKDENYELVQELKQDMAVLTEEIQAEFAEGSDPATIIDVDQVGTRTWP